MRYVCLIVILFLSAGLRAQESRFSVDGDFLTRGEIRSGGLSTNEEGETEDFAAFIFERSLKPLGHELELSGSYKLFKDCKLSAGYSFMWGTRTMVVLKRSSDRRRLHWGWLMLSVTPRFFTYNGK